MATRGVFVSRAGRYCQLGDRFAHLSRQAACFSNTVSALLVTAACLDAASRSAMESAWCTSGDMGIEARCRSIAMNDGERRNESRLSRAFSFLNIS